MYVNPHYVGPVVNITTIEVECGQVYVSWIVENSNICRIRNAIAELKNDIQRQTFSYGTYKNNVTLKGVPSDTLFNLTVYVTNTNTISAPGSPSSPTVVVRTMYMQCTYR